MRIFLLHILFSLCLPLVSRADTLQVREAPREPLNLLPHLELFVDSSGTLSAEEVIHGQLPFTSFDEPNLEGEWGKNYWLRLSIKSSLDLPTLWLLFEGRSEQYPLLTMLDYVDGWYVQNGKIGEHHRSGYFVPRREKSVRERAAANILPVDLAEGEVISFYIRLRTASISERMHISPVLMFPLPNVSYTTDWNKGTVLGSQGMYLIIGIFVLVFWVFIRQPSYLYFGLFCLLFGLHYSNIEAATSIADNWFPNHPHWALPIFLFAGSGSLILFLLFGRAFSRVKDRLPGWDLYFRIIIVLYTLIFGLSWISTFQPPYYPFSEFTFSMAYLLVLPLAIRFLFGKHLQAKIFAAGILWFMFWAMVGIFLYNPGILPLPFIPWPVGQVGLLLIYAVGLGYQLLDNERQKARAERIRELDAVKTRFFANISHEFRTPLSLILGPINQAMENIPASESVEDEEEVPVRGRHLKVMRRNALRLQNLVDQLLDLSKLDSGKMQLAAARGELVPFLRMLVFSFESLAERKHIHFHTAFPPEPEEAWYDRDKLEKILLNLLSNAFKFTPEHGRVGVTVEASAGRLRLQVADSGPGIPSEEADKLFDRFFQVEGTEAKGTGIGLALVKELVDLHGGQISVESVQGQGTTFKVTLPFARKAFPAGTVFSVGEKTVTSATTLIPEKAGESKISATAPDPSQPLALVVEDNPDLRQYIGESLITHYQLLTAADGEAGLQLALEQVPDIIVSDVMMPGLSGFELCEKLKTDPHTSHIPIILLTARAGQAHKLEGLQQGADAYLTKPFDLRELHLRMGKLIEQRQKLREHFGEKLALSPKGVQLDSMEERFLRQVTEEIEKQLSNEFFTVEDLAGAVGFSRSQLNRKIRALTDKTTNQLIREFRLTRAKDLLEQKAGTVSEIAYQVGYGNLSYFSKRFKEMFGKSPSEIK